MEILVDSSIPEPSRQVPLQQQLIERSASRPVDPLLQQRFDDMQQQGQAQHNAQLSATVAAIRDGAAAAAKGLEAGAVMRHAPTVHRLRTCLHWKKLL
jgi:hypothetical protein